MKGKCRVWDKQNNKWFEPTYEVYKGNLEELLFTQSGQICLRTMDGISHESLFPNRFIKSYYTGLKDKNGKEIYEGDVLQITSEFGKSYIDVVQFSNAAFVIVNKDIVQMYRINEDVQKGMFVWEVIGNIYENPELIP